MSSKTKNRRPSHEGNHLHYYFHCTWYPASAPSLFLCFFLKRKRGSPGAKQYQPGIYTSTLTLNNTDLEVEVAVDASHINSNPFSQI